MAGETRQRPKSTSSGFEAEEDENDEDLENFIDGIVKELDAADDGEDLAGLPDFKPDDLLGIGAVDGVGVGGGSGAGNLGAIGTSASTLPELTSPSKSGAVSGAASTSTSEMNDGMSGGSGSSVKNNVKTTVNDSAQNDAQNPTSFSSTSSSASTSTSGILMNIYRVMNRIKGSTVSCTTL